ncbi:MAG: transposase [Bryobacteraceae bacterium]|jgi:putative transposase
MARRPRVIVPGLAHHVTQAGNNRQEVFTYNDDRRLYLDLLGRYAQRYEAHILAYCLMADHVHLVVVPEREFSLACLMGRTNTEYTMAWNRVERRSGHLWHSRFRSCPVETSLLHSVLRYVERGPVRAGLEEYAWDYPWSSARYHAIGPDSNTILDHGAVRSLRDWDQARWKELLSAQETPLDLDLVRRATMTGRPLGSPGFIHQLETETGLSLRSRPRGRPRKTLVGGYGVLAPL